MKLDEVFNNYPKMYINVLPPGRRNPSTLIAAIQRARADQQGNMDSDYENEGQTGKLWPNHRFDRRVGNQVGTAIAQKARKLRRKHRDSMPTDLDAFDNPNLGVVE